MNAKPSKFAQAIADTTGEPYANATPKAVVYINRWPDGSIYIDRDGNFMRCLESARAVRQAIGGLIHMVVGNGMSDECY